MTVDTGTLLGDRYRLADRIATGGMGEVWRARDELLDRDVAVKVLKREYADDTAFLERFRAEARHTASLADPGIAGVYDYGESGGVAYLVMELVDGRPLSALLAVEGRLSAQRTLDIVIQAARALDAAHRGGVIHRDVKPGNILVAPDGIVKLTDFGIARAADGVSLTQTGTVMGTAHYLSPEQSTGRDVTPASDVYSLGVVTYECLAGRRPFDADTPVAAAMAHLYEDPRPLPDDVPDDVTGLVAQALAKDPADRFASAAAFATAAETTRSRLAGTPPAEVAPTMALPVVPEPERPRRQWWPIALVAVLLVVLGVAAWALLRPEPHRTVPPLVGRSRTAALAALDALGLEHTERTSYSRKYPAGTVMGQDPAARTVLRRGDNVSVTISKGPQPVVLPAGLTGRPVDEVARTLEALGLTVVRQGRENDATFGTVTAVTPATGLHQGDTVTVTYSLGPPPSEDGKKKHGKDEHGD